MSRPILPLLALFVVACEPQSATLVAGDYTAWLASTNSLTVAKGLIDYEAYGVGEDYFTIDCRIPINGGTVKQIEEFRLDNRLRICDDDRGNRDAPQGSYPVRERWIDQSGFHVVRGDLEPWRGEGFITSEGDVQIGFHQAIPGGQDFRFAITVDPEFQPRRCEQDGDGVAYNNIDGDWIEQWSVGANGATRFFLNAGASQFDPAGTDNASRWFLPLEWQAGYAAGQFVDDAFRVRPTRYAEPEIYLDVEADGANGSSIAVEDLYYCALQPEQVPSESICMNSTLDQARVAAQEIESEFGVLGVRDVEGLPAPRPIPHDNQWRAPDGFPGGLDGWVELNYSWIEFDAGSSFEPGGKATGRFHVVFDGNDSQSRFLVRGVFDVPAWDVDFWTAPYVPPIKFEENGNTVCGEDPNEVL